MDNHAFRQKRLVVLGAGVYQLPLIARAKQLGVETIVVSPRTHLLQTLTKFAEDKLDPFPTATGNMRRSETELDIKTIPARVTPASTNPQGPDLFVDLDTTDAEGVLKACRDLDIHGIATTGTDVAVPTIGRVTEALGLKGTKSAASLRSMNKILMKTCFADHGVPTARFCVVEHEHTLTDAARQIGFPLMVKAIDSSGSRGIFKAESLDDVRRFYARSRQVSKSGAVILEEFLDGYEIGADAVVVGQEVVEVFVHKREVAEPPHNAPIGHSMPIDLTEAQFSAVRDAILASVAALGIEDTMANFDLMMVGNSVYVIEAGARMGGTCLPDTISIYGGFDMYELIIRLALGLPINLPAHYKRQPNASRLIRSAATGVITNIDIPGFVRNHPNLARLSLDKHVGDAVNAFEVGPDRIGEVIVRHDSASQAEALVTQLVDQMTIEVAES